ncbi:hypothetical protein EON81_24435 [bacterium]|nr:MAG: hypothetical protein EON81_24435 [bacterium]
MSQTLEAARRLRAHADNIERLALPLDEVPEGHEWTRARILRHVVMTLVPYLSGAERGIAAMPEGAHERLRWIGKKFEWVAGPESNFAVPGKLVPQDSPSDPNVLKDFADAHRRLADLAERAEVKDGRKASIPVPLFPPLKLTPLEVFLVAAAHADRHVGQVMRPGQSSRT